MIAQNQLYSIYLNFAIPRLADGSQYGCLILALICAPLTGYHSFEELKEKALADNYVAEPNEQMVLERSSAGPN